MKQNRPRMTEATSLIPFVNQATVIKVVDGDTVDLAVDLGYNLGISKNRFRLYGIDTPERGQVNYKEATAALANIIPAGSRVIIRSYKPSVMPPADSFGRWVVEIFINGVNVNEAMLDSGLAVPFMREPRI